MTDAVNLLQAVRQSENTRNALFKALKDKRAGWKNDYIELRRLLQSQIATIGQLSDQWIASNGQSELAAQLRERVKHMRAELARHQASWPVVSIESTDPAYLNSMASIDSARGELTSFVMRHGIR